MSSDRSPVHDIVYHSFFSHLIGRMLCVAHACYPDQSLPIGLVYKLPLLSFYLFFFFAVCLTKPVMGETLHRSDNWK